MLTSCSATMFIVDVFTNLFHRANYHLYTHYSQHTFVHVISDFDALEVKTLTRGR